MVGWRKKHADPVEEPVDLSSRIGGRQIGPPAPEPPPVQRHDGPIASAGRGRAGLPEPDPAPPRATSAGRPTMIGLDEPFAAAPSPSATLGDDPNAELPLLSVREAPEFGEVDLIATPLPTPDDWHHFELALRTLRGIGQLRTEYYRSGVLKVRVRWSGADRFGNAVRSVPGYRVRVLGEDRRTVQVLIGRR